MNKEKIEVTEVNSIRKKAILDLLRNKKYVPMKEKELAIMLQIEKKDREELKKLLLGLLKDGAIQCTKKGKYMISTVEGIVGTFTANQHGFGFVEIEDREDDLFIAEKNINGAMHGDKVMVTLCANSSGKRQEGKVLNVLERATNHLVGIYEKSSKSYGFVVPDNKRFAEDIFIPVERANGAVDGHKVVVEIIDYGSAKKSPEGKIIEIIGHINDPGVDIMSIVKNYDLPVEFSEKVMSQAENVAEEVSEADMAGRLDLRDVLMITIDGEDAKDLDDAVSLEQEGEYYKLGVHIADVTNYVQERSALDQEALNRGTSVYLVDRVIPMLPHKLSNGICSLNAGENRLALSCIMTIDAKGDVVNHKIAETIICVDKRMSYTAVNAILALHDQEQIEQYENLLPMLNKMEELAAVLRKKRKNRGSIDFDFPETKIILDKKGYPIEIKPYERNVATKMIEEFMLVANETVAQEYYWQELPFLYRSHENPDPERIQKLAMFIRNFGYGIKIRDEEIHPKELQKLLTNIEGTPEEDLICRLTLRSMKRAKYATVSEGHFGLACRYYCHFTSPIRRYPDLQIHRIIKENLHGRLKEKRVEHYEKILPEVAKHTSEMERRADDAERDTEKLKKVEFMEKRIGEVFEGVISGITNWGIYVELPNTIEGLIHVSKLTGDYYKYDENNYEMVGEMTHKKYQLGEKIKVQVNGTDKNDRTIDFIIPEE